VAAQPDPPREVHTSQLARAVFSETAFRILLFVGVAWLGILCYAIIQGISSLGDVALVVLSFVGAAFMGTLLGGIVIRTRRVLRVGVRARAVVLSAKYTRPGQTSATLEAIEHGLATGVRSVTHPGGDFTEPFRFDHVDANQVSAGTVMEVLVDPVKPRVLLDVGLARAGDETD
jgi:hypothetical protein